MAPFCLAKLYLFISNAIYFVAGEEINKQSFLELTPDDLKDLGFKIGQQKDIQRIINVLVSPDSFKVIVKHYLSSITHSVIRTAK